MSFNPLDFLIGALAVWRASAMIAYERGPFAIFMTLRRLVGIDHFDDGTPITDGLKGEIARLFSCVWCLSLWIAIAWLIAWDISKELTMAGSYFLALSAGAVIIERLARE